MHGSRFAKMLRTTLEQQGRNIAPFQTFTRRSKTHTLRDIDEQVSSGGHAEIGRMLNPHVVGVLLELACFQR
jgi:hypothetical protein